MLQTICSHDSVPYVTLQVYRLKICLVTWNYFKEQMRILKQRLRSQMTNHCGKILSPGKAKQEDTFFCLVLGTLQPAQARAALIYDSRDTKSRITQADKNSESKWVGNERRAGQALNWIKRRLTKKKKSYTYLANYGSAGVFTFQLFQNLSATWIQWTRAKDSLIHSIKWILPFFFGWQI